jgi:dephospho-CoA kinase
MVLVGLTGGIGAGKSAVADLLAARGATVLDADAIARQVVAPGTPGLAAILRRFGPAVALPDGTLDRKALGKIVFGDDRARSDLETIVHPLVRARTAALAAAAPPDAVVVNDVPLLVEAGLAETFDLVVVVVASIDVRLRRLMGTRGMTEPEARARIGAQATEDQRRAVADFVITNEGTLGELALRVNEVWRELTAIPPRSRRS